MLDHDWTVEETGDATLVEVVVRNPTAVARRVRVVNRLDGPALPPGRKGVSDPGWDEDGYEGVVPPNERLTLGYACTAAPADPPVEVVDEGRATEATDDRPDAADALRLLGDHAPPVDALPGTADPENGAADADGAADETAGDATTGATVEGGTTETPPAPVTDMMDRLGTADEGEVTAESVPSEDVSRTTDSPDDGATERRTDHPGGAVDSTGSPTSDGDVGLPDLPDATACPDAVTAWLADVERRIEHGERLTDASVAEAAAVVEDRGGVDAVAALPDQLAADARALRDLADRIDDLTGRAAATDVPVDALRRLS